MNLPVEILQFLGSLIAILALAGIAYGLRLGQAPRLTDEAAIRRAAGEAVDGYRPTRWAINHEGNCAIMCDAEGRFLLLKLHGNKFAGRILGPGASAEIANGVLKVASGERRYGSVALAIAHPQAWADAVNGLRQLHDA